MTESENPRGSSRRWCLVPTVPGGTQQLRCCCLAMFTVAGGSATSRSPDTTLCTADSRPDELFFPFLVGDPFLSFMALRSMMF